MSELLKHGLPPMYPLRFAGCIAIIVSTVTLGQAAMAQQESGYNIQIGDVKAYLQMADKVPTDARPSIRQAFQAGDKAVPIAPGANVLKVTLFYANENGPNAECANPVVVELVVVARGPRLDAGEHSGTAKLCRKKVVFEDFVAQQGIPAAVAKVQRAVSKRVSESVPPLSPQESGEVPPANPGKPR